MPGTEVSQEKSVRGLLTAALNGELDNDDLGEDTELLEEETQESEPQEAPSAVEQTSEAQAALDKARDDKGRFAKAPKVKKSQEQISPQSQEVPTLGAVAAPPIEPPVSWRADKKAAFGTLPREVQEYIAQRENELTRGFQQTRQQYAEIERVMEPYAQDLQQAGHPVPHIIRQSLEWNRALKANPAEAIQQIAAMNGLEIKGLARAQQVPQNPQLSWLSQKVQTLEQRLQMEEQAKQHALTSQLQAQVDAFRQATDESGKAKYPHYATLEEDIALLIPRVAKERKGASTQEILSESYARAVRANPQTWNEFQKELEAKRLTESQARVQRAKIAGSSVAGSPTSAGNVREAPKSIRGLLLASRDGQL